LTATLSRVSTEDSRELYRAWRAEPRIPSARSGRTISIPNARRRAGRPSRRHRNGKSLARAPRLFPWRHPKSPVVNRRSCTRTGAT
jgi:hypothetical protein